MSEQMAKEAIAKYETVDLREIPKEVAKLFEVAEYSDALLDELYKTLQPILADEVPQDPAVSPAPEGPLTPLGNELRGLYSRMRNTNARAGRLLQRIEL